MRRLMLAILMMLFVMAAGASSAMASGAAAKPRPHDLTIAAPSTLYLAAPPYSDAEGILTYGDQATLEQVRDNANAVNPEVSKKPESPGRGFRWVGLKVKFTDTGSLDSTFPVPVVTGSDGQSYYGSDATMPGCAQLATSPPRTVAPGKTVVACDAYALPVKIAPRLAAINIGFANPAATGFWQIAARPLAKPKFPASYVALGDSYSSGEGSGDYDAKLETCHRGADAWPRLVARELPKLIRMRHWSLLACSGATSEALNGKVEGQPDQVALLHDDVPRPTLVTITIGGNDIKFPTILGNCVFPPAGCLSDGTLDRAEFAIEHEQHTLVTDYRNIKSADPKATILVVGYPRLFPQTQADVVTTCKLWLTDEVRASLNQLDADLNAVIHAAAARAGLRFIDVTDALNTHEGCSAHSWLSPIARPWGQERGHPTKPGQRAIAAIVREYLTGLRRLRGPAQR